MTAFQNEVTPTFVFIKVLISFFLVIKKLKERKKIVHKNLNIIF